MWQVQWMLSLLPDWFWSTLLIISVAGLSAAWVLKNIPFVSTYRFTIQVISIIGLVGSVWFLGAASTNAMWKSKIKDLEEKVRVAEEQAASKTVEVQEKVVTKTKIIREKSKAQIEYIDRIVTQDKEVIKYIEQCPVPKVIIDQHNLATELNKAAEGKK